MPLAAGLPCTRQLSPGDICDFLRRFTSRARTDLESGSRCSGTVMYKSHGGKPGRRLVPLAEPSLAAANDLQLIPSFAVESQTLRRDARARHT